MSVVRDIASALRLLTVIPLGAAEGSRPVRYFPLVGWMFAGIAVGIASGAVALGRASGIGAVLVATLIVSAWALTAGFLHWDGLADCADALGVRGDAQRRLAVMRESGIGAFGVVAIVLVAAMQVSAAAVVVESGAWWALGAAPVLGRLSAALALMTRRPARADGLASRYARRESVAGWMALAVPVVALALVGPVAARAIALGVSVLVAAVIPGLFARRLGGITGDVLGASVLLVEAFVLTIGALAGSAL